MEKKKTKLTLSGIAKKSIENIELAKTQGKHSVVIEKKSNRFSKKNFIGKSTSGRFQKKSSVSSKPTGFPVWTEQKPHDRVHISPRIIIVAVPRPQHS